MGFATKVQLIKRKSSEQWYINFPSAVAQAMEFDRGEVVEWFIEDKETLVLHRPEAAGRRLKKNFARLSCVKSKASSKNAGEPSGKKGTGKESGG